MKQIIQAGVILTLIIGGFLLLLLALRHLAALVILIIIAIVLTAGIDPLVQRVQSLVSRWWRMPRVLATLLVLLFGLGIILGALEFLLGTAIAQGINFAQNSRLHADLIHWFDGFSRQHPYIPNSTALLERARAQSGDLAQYLWSTTVAIFGILGGVFSAFTVLILTFFFTTYKDGIVYSCMQLVPAPYQARTREVGHKAAQKMGGWLRGQLSLALIITIVITVGMWLIGVRSYAVLIGIIGGVGELVPMVGPYLAFFPAIIILLVTGGATWQIVVLIIFFAILSQVENYVLSPKIMERQVELHPVTTILALLIGGSLLGLVGALLAIPLAAAGRVILLEVVFPAIQKKPTVQIEQNRPEVTQLASGKRKRKRGG